MSTTSTVIYEVRDRIGYITLNRPDRMNAINAAMRHELMDVFADVRNNDGVWVAILTGAGKAFCAGRDLIERVEKGDGVPGPHSWDIYTLQNTIYKPMIAAINGVCVAQGCGLALGCDIRIMAEGARLGWPQVKRGVSSVSGPTLLARMVPRNIAFQYMFTGDFMSSQEALDLRLVNQVVPDGELMNVTEVFARRLLENAPLAMRAMKEATVQTAHMRAEEAYTLAKFILESCDRSEDTREGLQAFAEKRPPVWKGR